MGGVYHSCEGCSRRGSVPGFFFFNFHFFTWHPISFIYFFSIVSQATSFSLSLSLSLSLASLGNSSPPMKITNQHRISLKSHLGLGGRTHLSTRIFFFSPSLSLALDLFSLSLSHRGERDICIF